MADFELAYNKTDANEHGWVNDPLDNGKETWDGISRKFHPAWAGWPLIDALKKLPGFPANTYKDERLLQLKQQFYRQNFWNRMNLDAINNQTMAYQIYDMGVNAGLPAAIKLAERAVGLPETGKISADLLNRLNHV